MTDRNKANEVAQSVRAVIAQSPPFDNMTLDVDANGIYSTISGDQTWWRVPVIPRPWPHRMYALYEALAEIEGVLQDEQGLAIILFPGEPTEAGPAEAISAN